MLRFNLFPALVASYRLLYVFKFILLEEWEQHCCPHVDKQMEIRKEKGG